MPNLGDYIGQLLSEITIARMQADLEAVRVAELYASHPYLRHMPVPHFRMPNIEMDLPVVIKAMEEPASGAYPRGAPTPAEMRKAFDAVLAAELEKENIRMTPRLKERLKSVLDERGGGLLRPTEIAVDVSDLADELTKAVTRKMTESEWREAGLAPEKVKALEKRMMTLARNEFIKLRKPPERLKALVTTAEIREAGPSEVMTRFRLKITEEAFEWTTIESEGEKKNRLIPE
ncbi:MAG: hypothetical protein HQL76_02155 [Magnetococcales bacterium]|nr:hypothetical protein [Magnetococcales bacterium]